MSEINKKSSSFNILSEKFLYTIPLGSDDNYLLYAPLADSCLLLTRSDIDNLSLAVSCPDKANEEALEIIDALTDVVPVTEREERVESENDFINLSLLPNNTCNFSCSYCYSAKGRSKQQLDFDKARMAIEYFMSLERNQSDLLTISIFGGGEPLLSWDNVVRPSLDLIAQKAKEQDRKVVVTLITNGSIIPKGFIERCKSYSIDLVCSYEILEEIQNAQRKHYNVVSDHISKMIESGVVPAINSVVTELNVSRQSEMIEVLHNKFPQIHNVAFEPVIDSTIKNKHAFYVNFSQNFIKALSLAGKYNIKLTCSILRNVDVTVDRYCAGELALCADGSFSICPCVSSPMEENYSRYVYGEVRNDGVFIDSEKLHSLLSVNVDSNTWCKKCFARFNCGGGCMNNNINNGNRQDVDYCRFVQGFLKYTLLKRLDAYYIEDSGVSIKEKIGNYEQFIGE